MFDIWVDWADSNVVDSWCNGQNIALIIKLFSILNLISLLLRSVISKVDYVRRSRCPNWK